MRNCTIVRTPAVKRDLGNIWIAIAQKNRRAATHLLMRIDSRIQGLSDFPELGPAHPEIAEGLRMLVEGRYLILYRLRGETVEIVRVVHGARDLSALF